MILLLQLHQRRRGHRAVLGLPHPGQAEGPGLPGLALVSALDGASGGRGAADMDRRGGGASGPPTFRRNPFPLACTDKCIKDTEILH